MLFTTALNRQAHVFWRLCESGKCWVNSTPKDHFFSLSVLKRRINMFGFSFDLRGREKPAHFCCGKRNLVLFPCHRHAPAAAEAEAAEQNLC